MMSTDSRKLTFATLMRNYANDKSGNATRPCAKFLENVIRNEGAAKLSVALAANPQMTTTEAGDFALHLGQGIMGNAGLAQSFIDIELPAAAGDPYTVTFDRTVTEAAVELVLGKYGPYTRIRRPGDSFPDSQIVDTWAFAVTPGTPNENKVPENKPETGILEATVGTIDKSVWSEAEAAALKQYGAGTRDKNPDKFYAITMSIYKKMKGVEEGYFQLNRHSGQPLSGPVNESKAIAAIAVEADEAASIAGKIGDLGGTDKGAGLFTFESVIDAKEAAGVLLREGYSVLLTKYVEPVVVTAPLIAKEVMEAVKKLSVYTHGKMVESPEDALKYMYMLGVLKTERPKDAQFDDGFHSVFDRMRFSTTKYGSDISESVGKLHTDFGKNLTELCKSQDLSVAALPESATAPEILYRSTRILQVLTNAVPGELKESAAILLSAKV